MPSTHEPVQLLQPSDLLEPLDLSDRQADLFYRSAGTEPSATAQRGRAPASGRVPTAGRGKTERRSPLKPILMITGALACFGAGTALPQFQALLRGDVGSAPTTVGASASSAPIADVLVKSDAAAKSDESKLAHPDSDASNQSKTDTALSRAGTAATLSAAGTAPPSAQNAADRNGSAVDRTAQGTRPANDDTAGCAGPCNQQPCPKGDANCLEGGAPKPAQDLTTGSGGTKPTKAAQPVRQAAGTQQPGRQVGSPQERVDAGASEERRASNGQDERAQSFRRNKATAQRERTDQPSGTRRNIATMSRSSRGQDRASDWRRDAAADDVMPTTNSSSPWQSRDGWRERVVDEDDIPAVRSSGRPENVDRVVNRRRDRPSEDRWEERDVDRTANWRRERPSEGRWQERDGDRVLNSRRDRYDEYSRNDNRRGKGSREDDFVMGRFERNDGPLMIFPSRYRW